MQRLTNSKRPLEEDSESEDFLHVEISAPPSKRPKRHEVDWMPLDSPDWLEFYQTWWGSEKRQRFEEIMSMGRLLCIEQFEVYAKLGLDFTDGCMFVRQELVDAYNRLSSACASVYGGVAYFGNPGTGKSYSLVYFMLRRMATEQPTLLTTTAGTAYLVDERGVWRADDGLTEDHIPPSFEKIPFNKRIWSLIDSSSEPSAALTKSSHVFPVHMTSATDVQPLRWCQQNSALKWIMNPWDNPDELIASMLLSDEFTKLTLMDQRNYRATVESLVKFSGPYPRDLLSLLKDAENARTSLEYTLDTVNLRGLVDILQSISNPTPISLGKVKKSLRFTLFVVRRVPHQESNTNFKCSDNASLDFKSPFINDWFDKRMTEVHFNNDCSGFSTRLREANFRDLKHLFDACASHPADSTLAEVICTKLLHNAFTSTGFTRAENLEPFFGPFRKMERGQSVEGSMIWYADTSSRCSESSSMLEGDANHPFYKRIDGKTLRYFDDIQDIEPLIGDYGPEEIINIARCASVHPFIDTVIFEVPYGNDSVKADTITLWIIRLPLPVRKPSKPSTKDYDAVRLLRRKVEEYRRCLVSGPGGLKLPADFKVEVKYVLMTFKDAGTESCLFGRGLPESASFELPPGLDAPDVKGDVYVQYLNLKWLREVDAEAEAREYARTRNCWHM